MNKSLAVRVEKLKCVHAALAKKSTQKHAQGLPWDGTTDKMIDDLIEKTDTMLHNSKIDEVLFGRVRTEIVLVCGLSLGRGKIDPAAAEALREIIDSTYA